MYEKLNDVTLKNGEQVELGIVMGPDLEWADRIDDDLLGHKGPTWRWGNRAVLEQDLDMDSFLYILHRDGVPFSNVMTIEYEGVGILGHVFTKPEDRRQGAASAIFKDLMAHFEARNGRALILGTGYDSHPYHIYKLFGFEGLEPQSGTMAYYTAGEEAFRQAYFDGKETVIERLSPRHYPGMPIICAGDYLGVVRSAGAMRLFGRCSSEGSLVPLLKESLERERENKPIRTAVARLADASGVVGFATTDRDPIWGFAGVCIVDVYCHPDFWHCGEGLLDKIEWPSARRYVAYCDIGWTAKEDVLRAAGFVQETTLKQWVPVDRAGTGFADVNIWVKG